MPNSQSVQRALVTPSSSQGNQLLRRAGTARDGRWRERGQQAGEDEPGLGLAVFSSTP